MSLSRLGCGQNATGAGESSGGAVNASGGTSSSAGASASGASGTATSQGGGASGGTSSGGSAQGGATSGGVAQGASAAGGTAQGGAAAGATSLSGGKSGSAGGNSATTGGAANAGAAGNGGSAGSVACPLLDTANPPTMLTLSGNLGTHDPSLIFANNQYYEFQTGRGLPTKTSTNLMAWQGGSSVFSANPAWIAQQVPSATDLWAPDISFFGGMYHLYYAASTFGSNQSCIGHATRASLSSGAWTDLGSLICSTSSDNWNAIDPAAILDDAGTPWLAFGSFWGGIKLIKLDNTGARADTQLLSIAARPANGGALEGAYIVHTCGYYYLFVSFDHCCDSPWNYSIHVGRATSVTGPYTDQAGTAMLQGGGTLLVQGNATWTAPGHNAVIITPNGAYNVYHALNASHANPTLRVAQIAWDAQGWPVSAGP